MNEAKLEKQKKKLVDAGLMEPSDSVLDFLQIYYRDRLLAGMANWKNGWGYFTETRLVLLYGLTGRLVIPYQSIRRLKPCRYRVVFPLGIRVSFENPETGQEETHTFSIWKRGKWLAFLAERAGIPL